MNRRRSTILLIVILMISSVLLTSCGDEDITVEGFGFERFGITMPEEGTVLYDSFINIGFDFREYAVIAYDSNEELSKLPWTEADLWEVAEFKTQMDRHDICLQSDGSAVIPIEYRPNGTGLQKMYLDRVGKEISTMKCYLLYDADKCLVYVYIKKT